MDKLTITRSFVPKAKGQQPSGTAQSAQPAWQGQPPYDPFDAPDDDAGLESSDEDEVAQPQDGLLPDAGPADATPAPNSKPPQIVAPILTGAQVQAEFSRRLEAARSKRKRRESTSDAQDESAAKQRRLIKVEPTAGCHGEAITEESVSTRPAPEAEGKRLIARVSKTEITRKKEDPSPVKQREPTSYKDIDLSSTPAIPITIKQEANPSSRTPFNQLRNQDSSRIPSRTLTKYEMAAIEEARTHKGLRICAVRQHDFLTLQEVQKAGPPSKRLHALSRSETRVLEKQREKRENSSDNYRLLSNDEWAIIQIHRSQQGQIKAVERAPIRDEASNTQNQTIKAKSTIAEFGENHSSAANESHAAQGQRAEVREVKSDPEQENE